MIKIDRFAESAEIAEKNEFVENGHNVEIFGFSEIAEKIQIDGKTDFTNNARNDNIAKIVDAGDKDQIV